MLKVKTKCDNIQNPSEHVFGFILFMCLIHSFKHGLIHRLVSQTKTFLAIFKPKNQYFCNETSSDRKLIEHSFSFMSEINSKKLEIDISKKKKKAIIYTTVISRLKIILPHPFVTMLDTLLFHYMICQQLYSRTSARQNSPSKFMLVCQAF